MLDAKQIHLILKIAKAAGSFALDLRTQGLIISAKKDKTAVTNADKDVEHMIINGIRDVVKNDDIIISEEMVADGVSPIIKKGEPFWSIDPIDSTATYIKGGNHFCINIAYIENNIPVFGIIYAPALKTLWYGLIGLGSFKQIGENPVEEISCRIIPKDGTILVSSEEQATPAQTLETLKVAQDIKIPSAIKLTYVAEGKADYYLRKRHKACDWDLASGIALILAAKGGVKYLDDENFQYGQPPYLSPALLACGRLK